MFADAEHGGVDGYYDGFVTALVRVSKLRMKVAVRVRTRVFKGVWLMLRSSLPERCGDVVPVQRAVLQGGAVELEEERRLVLRARLPGHPEGEHNTQRVKYEHQLLLSTPETNETAHLGRALA